MVDGITIQLFIKQDYQHSKGCVSSHKDIWGYKKHQLAIHYSSALIAAEVGDHGLWLLGVGLFSLWKQEDSLSWHELQTPGLNHQGWIDMLMIVYLQCVDLFLLHT